jgi:hypothetical protein
MIWRAYPLAIGAAVACLGYGFGLGRLLGIAVNIGDAGILGIACMVAPSILFPRSPRRFRWSS